MAFKSLFFSFLSSSFFSFLFFPFRFFLILTLIPSALGASLSILNTSALFQPLLLSAWPSCVLEKKGVMEGGMCDSAIYHCDCYASEDQRPKNGHKGRRKSAGLLLCGLCFTGLSLTPPRHSLCSYECVFRQIYIDVLIKIWYFRYFFTLTRLKSGIQNPKMCMRFMTRKRYCVTLSADNSNALVSCTD